MTGPWFFLRSDESVALRVSPMRGYGFSLFFGLALVPTALFVASVVALRALPPWRMLALAGALAALALLVAAAIFAWRRTVTTEYAVTDARLYARTGQLFVHLHFTTHDKVTDIHFHQGPLDRLFGVSAVTFVTAGGDVRVAGVADALAVKAIAEAAREAFVERLLERAGVNAAAARREASVAASREASMDAPAERAAVPPIPAIDGPRPSYLKQGDRMLWLGRPTTRAAWPALLPIGFVAFFVTVVSSSGGLTGGLVGLFVLAAAAASFAVAFVRLKRTEFVVTDRGVYSRSGVVGTTVAQLTFEKITDITYRQDLAGRILGYASLSVNTAGSATAPVVMAGLEKALDVKSLVERARGAALREESA